MRFVLAIGPRVNNSHNNDNNLGEEKNLDFIDIVDPIYSLEDLILPSQTWESIHDFLSYKENEDLIFKEWGLEETHTNHYQNAINLYGAPGTGKTMASIAIAHQLKKPLIIVDYANLESKYVGETSKNISKIFKFAEDNKAIIFFDEADAVLSKRVTNMSSSTDVSVNQTRSVLLTLMNNHKELLIFATNFIENYDPAFMRRIIAHIQFVLPDFTTRVKLWEKYIPLKMPCEINLNFLSEKSEGLSGSDIANAVKKTAFSAARKKQSLILNDDFIRSIDEIKNSKKANTAKKTTFTKSEEFVSEEFVQKQLSNNLKDN